MIILRNNYFSKTNLGGDYVEFVDEKGYLNNKSGKVKKLNVKNLINLVKRNPKTSAAVLAGTTVVGTGVGVGRHLYKKNKQKTYSEEGNKDMGLGTKLAIGAGTAAAAFAGARRGMLGTGIARSTNTLWAKAGQKIGGNVGDNMILNASKHAGNATATEAAAKYANKHGGQVMDDARKTTIANNAGSAFMNKFI